MSIVKKNSVKIRLWHWANTLVITGSLLTVLLTSTLLDKHTTAAFIKTQLQQSGAAITDQQARSVSNGLENKVWDVHIYFGYALAALLLFRFLSEIFQRTDQKFSRKLKAAYQDYKTAQKNWITRDNLIARLSYAGFYLLLILIVFTGLSLAFDDELGISKSMGHTIKSVHGFCMYLVLAFIILHIAGVFLAERKHQSGVVSDMINGGKQEDKG